MGSWRKILSEVATKITPHKCFKRFTVKVGFIEVYPLKIFYNGLRFVC